MIHTIDRYLGPEPLTNGSYAHIYLLRCGQKIRTPQGSLEPGVGVKLGAEPIPCPACRHRNLQHAAATSKQAATNVSPGGIASGQVGGYDVSTKSIDSDLGSLEDDGEELSIENDPFPEA